MSKNGHDIKQIDKNVCVEAFDALTLIWNHVVILIESATGDLSGVKNIVLVGIEC